MFKWFTPKKEHPSMDAKHKAIELKKEIAIRILNKKMEEPVANLEDRRVEERRKFGAQYA